MRINALALLAFASVGMAQAATIRQTFTVPIPFDSTSTEVQLQRFNPAMGTLNSVSSYTFLRSTGTVRVENMDAFAGVGTVRFILGITAIMATPFGDSILSQATFASKVSETSLAAFDGTADYLGASSFQRTYNASAGVPSSMTTDAATLTFVTGNDTVPVEVSGQKNIQWRWYSRWSMNGQPALDLSSTGTATLVVTYDYTPFAP